MMLELLSSQFLALLLQVGGAKQEQLDPVRPLSWQEAEIFNLPLSPDRKVEAIVQEYIQALAAKGIDGKGQKVWIQSDWTTLANYEGTVAASAASLTKIATTLAVLSKWGPDYRFVTSIYGVGSVEDGVLKGDLVIAGTGDPLFVWFEAIALGNALNKLGIRQVTGNLLITGNFAMNFKSDGAIAGNLLKQGLNNRLWTFAPVSQHSKMPEGTPKPEVVIAGAVKVTAKLPENAKLLLRHQSMTLTEILKQMNIYSNNKMAEMLAQTVGGGKVVAKIAAEAAKVPASEIQLINGSGLGLANKVSPRAASAMLMAIERELQSQAVRVTDLFPVAGRDSHGTMENRQIPKGTTVKTGTLNQVSALAGVIPTEERGLVWFAIVNSGYQIGIFRREQDRFLQRLAQHWQLTPLTSSPSSSDYLGNPNRNQIIHN